jgi:hypothetical protein
MKKVLFFSMLACSLAFYACKKDAKEDDAGGETPTKIDTVYLNDRSALATKVKVAFGIASQGSIPAATTESGTPVLVENKNIVDAVSGRYIVIKPSFSYYESTIKGYYVSIVGSGGHFEIDYSANRGFYRQAPQVEGSLFREGDYVDSSIIIKLPKYIVGDTLSLTYAAYDSLGHISNQVPAHVRIHSQNGIADYQDFVGTWKVNRKTDANGVWQNYYVPDTSRTNFACVNNQLQYCLNNQQTCFSGIAAITAVTKYDLMFTDTNEYSELFSATLSRVIMDNSTCDKLTYGTQTISKLEKGGWSFNAETKIMTIVVDNNGIEYDNFYSYQVKVLEMTPQMVTLVRLDNTSYTVELVKK